MKQAVFSFFIMLFSAALYGQAPNAEYALALDFSAEQTNLPYPSHAAAYLINASGIDLVFSAGSWGGGWTGQVNLYGADGYASINEASTENKETFTLHPNERVKIFSNAFSLESRALYPYSYLQGVVYANGQRKTIIAFLTPRN